jgi:hypothetical protein
VKRRRTKKQLQKAKAREKRIKKNRQELSARRKARAVEKRIRELAPLPEFRIDASEATSDIVAMVNAGISELDSCYTKIFEEDVIVFMGNHVRNGWTDMVNSCAASIEDMTREEVERGLVHMLDSTLGNGILRCAPGHLVRRALPVSCYTLQPAERHWDIRCRSLRSLKTKHGCLYQSPHQPTIQLNDQPLQVSFTRHALTQLADRITPKWEHYYIGQVYVFGFLYECVYFETTILSTGQPAFVVYNSCLRTGKHMKECMRELLKAKTDKELARYYYKVGYCPINKEGELAVAKTFLTPGYWQTPERQTIPRGRQRGKNASLLRDIEQACDEGINTISVASCERTRNAVKWFHNHGVPQVKKIEQEVFRDAAGPYSFLSAIPEDLPSPSEPS